MNLKIKHYVFWTAAVILSIFILSLNIQFPDFVEGLYVQKNFVCLNDLAKGQGGQESLGYYVGKIGDVWVGPLSSVITHVLFAVFCLLYLKNTSSRVFCCVIFLFLILTKFNVLFYPPYGDAIGGPFAEAFWLSRHNFDYAGLLQQPSYNLGGPRVYFFSIYPTYLAILLKFIPSTKIFLVINHLFVYAMSAVIVTLTRNIMLKAGQLEVMEKFFPSGGLVRSGASSHAAFKNSRNIQLIDITAMLTSVIVLALPLFQSQTEAINMEIPCLLFSVWAVYCLIQKKIGKGLIMAELSLLIKGYGIIPCGTVFCISICLFFFDSCREEQGSLKGSKRLLLYSFLAIMSIVFMAGSKFLLKDQHAAGGMIGVLNGLPSLKIMYLPRLYGMSFVLFFGLVLWKEGISIKGLFEKYYPQFVVFVCAGMWFVLFLNYTEVSPRYKLALAPYLILCLVFAVLSVLKIFFRSGGLVRSGASSQVALKNSRHTQLSEKSAIILLMLAISMTALGSYGFYHHPVIPNYHIFSERSLEYRNDLKLNRRLAKMIEEEYPTMTIGAPFIMAQMLAIPQFGYVRFPLKVIAYGMPIRYGNIKNFEGLKKEDILKTLWIGVAAQFEKRGSFQYPVHAQDRIIKELVMGENRATLFMGGFAIEQKRNIIYALQQR